MPQIKQIGDLPMSNIVKMDSEPTGVAFARMAMAEGLAKRHNASAHEIALQRWPDSRCIEALTRGGVAGVVQTKAAIASGATAEGNWARALSSFDGAAKEFVRLAVERSLIGRIGGWKRVPLAIRNIFPANGFTAVWVGESQPKPVSAATFGEDDLPRRKVSALAVLTEELMLSERPEASALARDMMLDALVAAINQTLIDPTNAGAPDIEPAALTNAASGAVPVTAGANLAADLDALVEAFPGDLSNAVLVGDPKRIRKLLDAGQPLNGGTAGGLPAVATKYADGVLALIDPTLVAMGYDDIEVRVSREATIEMSDTPTGSTTNLVSLWQSNSAAILTEQYANWAALRPAVSVIKY